MPPCTRSAGPVDADPHSASDDEDDASSTHSHAQPEPERFAAGLIDYCHRKRFDELNSDALTRSESLLRSEQQRAKASPAPDVELDTAITDKYGSHISDERRTSLRLSARAEEAAARQKAVDAAKEHEETIAELKARRAAQKMAARVARKQAFDPNKPKPKPKPKRTTEEKLANDERLKDPACAWFLDERFPARYFALIRWTLGAVRRHVRVDDLVADLLTELHDYHPSAFFDTQILDDDTVSTDFPSIEDVIGCDPFCWAPLLAVLQPHLERQRASTKETMVPLVLAAEQGVLFRNGGPTADPVFVHLSISQCGLLGQDGKPAPQIIEKDGQGDWIGQGPTELVEHWKADTVERLLPGWISMLDMRPLKRILYFYAQDPPKYRSASVNVRTQECIIDYGAALLCVFYSSLEQDNVVVRLVEVNGVDAQRVLGADRFGRLSMDMGRPTCTRCPFGRDMTVLVNNHSTKVLRTTSQWLRALIFLVYVSLYLAEAEKYLLGPHLDHTRVASRLKDEYRTFLSSVGAEGDNVSFDDVLTRIGGIDSQTTFEQIAKRAQAVLASLTRGGRVWQFKLEEGDVAIKPVSPRDSEFGTVWQRLQRCMHEFRLGGVLSLWASLDDPMKSILVNEGFVTTPPSPDYSVNTTLALGYLCRSKWKRIEQGYADEARKLALKPSTIKLIRGMVTAGPWTAVINRKVDELRDLRFQAALYIPQATWCKHVVSDDAKFEQFFRFIQDRLPAKYKLKAVSHGPHARPGEPLKYFKKLTSASVQLAPYEGSIQALLTAAGLQIGFTDKFEERFNGSPFQEVAAREAYDLIFGEAEASDWDLDVVKTIFAVPDSPGKRAAGYTNVDTARTRRELVDMQRTAIMQIEAGVCEITKIGGDSSLDSDDDSSLDSDEDSNDDSDDDSGDDPEDDSDENLGGNDLSSEDDSDEESPHTLEHNADNSDDEAGTPMRTSSRGSVHDSWSSLSSYDEEMAEAWSGAERASDSDEIMSGMD